MREQNPKGTRGSVRVLRLKTNRSKGSSHKQPSSKSQRQEFFVPVSGFVWFYPEEVDVINHPAFQRLGRINQLGYSFIAYRGATHKRFEHVLGAVHIVQRMAAAVQHNQEKVLYNLQEDLPELAGSGAAEPLSNEELRFVRLGALLHDIGHIAAGHTLEDELGLCSPHDADERLELIFGKRPDDFDAEGQLSLGDLIDREYAYYAARALPDIDLPASKIVRVLIRKRPPEERRQDPQSLRELEREYENHHRTLTAAPGLRLRVCADMIGNTVCADLLDYLYRDWYHIGKCQNFEDRVLQYMEIRPPRSNRSQTPADTVQASYSRSASDRFVIALGSSPKIKTDGVSAILRLLEWRYELAEAVLFHKTKVAAAAMLDRALFELWGEKSEDEIIRSVFNLSDEQLIDNCLDRAKEARALAHGSDIASLDAAIVNLKGLKNRQLMTAFCTWTLDNLDPNLIKEVKQLYGGEGHVSKDCARRRTETLRHLEGDFGLNAGSLAMYCAEAKPKIAEVLVAVGDDVEKFDKYEADNDHKLSGGHLDAQTKRFRRLWRIIFFIKKSDKHRLESIGLLQELRKVIETLVLPKGDKRNRIESAHSYACIFAGNKDLGWENYEPICTREKLARGRLKDFQNLQPTYPTGAPCIRAFLRPIDGSAAAKLSTD